MLYIIFFYLQTISLKVFFIEYILDFNFLQKISQKFIIYKKLINILLTEMFIHLLVIQNFIEIFYIQIFLLIDDFFKFFLQKISQKFIIYTKLIKILLIEMFISFLISLTLFVYTKLYLQQISWNFLLIDNMNIFLSEYILKNFIFLKK